MFIYHYLHEAVDSYREKMVATRFAMITYAIPYVFFGSLAVGISLIAGCPQTKSYRDVWDGIIHIDDIEIYTD